VANRPIDWAALLRDFRKTRGMKQSCAAGFFGVSQATISRWERGAIEPTVAQRNRLFKALRRDRSPLDTLYWVETFRRLMCPGAVTSKQRVMHAMTDAFAARVGVPREEIEGLRISELFGGEVLHYVDRARNEGVFTGEVASTEACARFEVDPNIRRDVSFNCHYISWPHFTDDGSIVSVSQGRFIDDAEAGAVRERLGGQMRFSFAA
jgi:transcriptional regulator with XRE-family HTH domain